MDFNSQEPKEVTKPCLPNHPAASLQNCLWSPPYLSAAPAGRTGSKENLYIELGSKGKSSTGMCSMAIAQVSATPRDMNADLQAVALGKLYFPELMTRGPLPKQHFENLWRSINETGQVGLCCKCCLLLSQKIYTSPFYRHQLFLDSSQHREFLNNVTSFLKTNQSTWKEKKKPPWN